MSADEAKRTELNKKKQEEKKEQDRLINSIKKLEKEVKRQNTFRREMPEPAFFVELLNALNDAYTDDVFLQRLTLRDNRQVTVKVWAMSLLAAENFSFNFQSAPGLKGGKVIENTTAPRDFEENSGVELTLTIEPPSQMPKWVTRKKPKKAPKTEPKAAPKTKPKETPNKKPKETPQTKPQDAPKTKTQEGAKLTSTVKEQS